MPPGAFAEDSSDAPSVLEDVKLYFTAPLRWDAGDWVFFGGALAAIGVSHEFDGRVRSRYATGANAILNGENKHSLRDAAPTVALIAGTFAYAGFLGDSAGYRETGALLEAAVFSSVTAEALSYAAGRERPDATTDANAWRKGGDSFPSVHATAAFAVGTVLAESGNDDYRWIRRLIGYGVAGGTAFVRIHENVHWLSDTVAGNALGIATARFVLDRQEAENRASVQFQPQKGGWQLSYVIRTE